MEEIIRQLIHNFDFALMLVINIITYGLIKLLDEINKEKIVTTWQKRIIFVLSAITMGIIYYFITDIKPSIIVNSIIIAPVAWSWIAKPIASKFGIDYKKKIKVDYDGERNPS